MKPSWGVGKVTPMDSVSVAQPKRFDLNNLQRIGGIAALIEAATFIVGFVLLVTRLEPANYGAADVDPQEHAAFLVDNQAVMYAWNLTIYVVFGIFLVVLALALQARLKNASPALVQVGTVFGLIWAGLVIASGMVANVGAGVVVDLYGRDPAQAGSVWLTLDFVVNGLGGGNEIVGGLWVLLISWAALRSARLPAPLNYLGLVAGAAGIITTIPALDAFGAVFGLGLIVWFVWLGIAMQRESPGATT